MSFSKELKDICRHYFLPQEAFARGLNVSFFDVNRWEGDRAKSNLNAMKKLKSFCEMHDIDFSNLEIKWEKLGKEV